MAKVIVADDDPRTCAVLSRLLSGFDCTAYEAADGAAALELARLHHPELVLLDIYMPKKDGISVLRELAQEQPEARFIMITGNDDQAVAQKCLEFGACDYVTKPLDLDVLAIIIAATIARK